MADENIKKCDGRCDTCNLNQRSYCSAQMMYYLRLELAEIKDMMTKNNEGRESIIVKEKDDISATTDTLN